MHPIALLIITLTIGIIIGITLALIGIVILGAIDEASGVTFDDRD